MKSNDIKLFTKKEIIALKSFNDICSKIRGDYSKDAKGLFKIWITTLNIYKGYQENSMTRLLSALVKRIPHWKIDVYKHNETYDQIKYCFYRMCKALESTSNGKYSNSCLGAYHTESYFVSDLEIELKELGITNVFLSYDENES